MMKLPPFLKSVSLSLFAFLLFFSGTMPSAADTVVSDKGVSVQAEVLGVANGMATLKTGAAQMNVALSNIKSVVKTAPPEFDAAEKNFAEGKWVPALAGYKTVAGKFGGLPVVWAKTAIKRQAEVYIQLSQLPEAEKIYDQYATLYAADSDTTETQVGKARIAFAKKDYAAVKDLLDSVATGALAKESVSADQGRALGGVFLLRGQANEAAGNFVDALQDYLHVVTLFYQDKKILAEAEQKAKKLRLDQKVSVP